MMTLQAQGCFKLHQTLLQYGGAPTDPLPTSPEHPGPSVSGEAPAQALLPSGCAEPCRTPRGRCPPRRSLAPGHARTASAGDLRGRRDRAGDAGRAAGSPPRTHPAAHTHAGGGRHRLAGGGVQPAAAFSVPIYPRRNRPEAVAAPPPTSPRPWHSRSRPTHSVTATPEAPRTLPSRARPRGPGCPGAAQPRCPPRPLRPCPLTGPAAPPARTAWSHPACRLPVGQWRGVT